MATQYTAGLSAGQVLTAATMNQIGAATETFTPTIVGVGGGQVTINNGTLSGTYFRFQKLVIVNYILSWGSTTTTTCTGLWLFSVPVGNAITGAAFGRITDAGTTYYRVTGVAASNKMILQGNDTGNEVLNTQPMTWATNDFLNVTFVYETSA